MALTMIAISVLAAPNILSSREYHRAVQSFEYLESVKTAQDRFRQIHGRYAGDLSLLDIDRPEPTFFAVGDVVIGPSGSSDYSWSLTLTRYGDASLYGRYTVTFNERGFDTARSTAKPDLIPTTNYR